jgi:hypothetical protein
MVPPVAGISPFYAHEGEETVRCYHIIECILYHACVNIHSHRQSEHAVSQRRVQVYYMSVQLSA